MRRLPKIRALGLFVLFLGFFALPADATTYYVDINSPNPTPPYTNWSTASTDIQSAVNFTTNGDLVLVNPGVYESGGYTAPDGTLSAVVVSNSATLQSMTGASATFINGSNDMRCIYLQNASAVAGFTITNGGVNYGNENPLGDGIYCQSTACLISNCVITHCSGGVYLGTFYNCTFTANNHGAVDRSIIFNCIISNNVGSYGAVEGGILNNCLIVSNTAEYGGAVNSAPGLPVVLNNCIISNNTSQYGGGVYNDPSPPLSSVTNCILNNCTLTHNSASAYGGGALDAQLNNCLISSNNAPFGGGVEGGYLNNCTLIGNSATSRGGGADGSDSPQAILSNCLLIANVAGDGGGASQCTLNQCTLLQNTNNSGARAGGGAFNSILNNCLVISNSTGSSSGTGGGTYDCALTNCILANNTAGTYGGGAYGFSQGIESSTLVNCTVTANTASSGGGVYNCTVDNSILFYNNGGDYYSSTSQYPLNYCCTAVLATNGFRNITNTPLFVSSNNFQLQPNSPCINSGNNAYVSTSTDLAGNPRIVGGTVDIGAYEYQTPTSVISYAYLQQYGLPTDGSVDFADLDGTAFNVYQDWVTGLNPTNSASVLAMLTPAATNNVHGITVTWQSVSGISYNLLRSTNLPAFTTIQSGITGQSGTTSYKDTSATNSFPYFYRVSILAP